MRRAFVISVMVIAGTVCAGASSMRVRPLSPRMADLVQDARLRSPTIAGLLERIEASDVIVQLQFVFDSHLSRAETRLVAATAEARYLRVSISPRVSPQRRIELLAHELQHVIEIMSDGGVRDDESLRRRFSYLGWKHGTLDSYETPAAIEVERLVRRELRGCDEPLLPRPS